MHKKLSTYGLSIRIKKQSFAKVIHKRWKMQQNSFIFAHKKSILFLLTIKLSTI